MVQIMTRYRLHYAPDNASLIVRLALEQLGADYETILVDRSRHGQKSPEYLALNPNGLIPVLETPDGAMFETAAILLWLADRHGALAPAPDSKQRADFLKWLVFISNTIHPALRMMFYPHCYVGDDVDAQKALRAHIRGELAAHFTKLDDLAGQGTSWFAAADPSILDFYVACTLRWVGLYPKKGIKELSINNWPNLQAMAAQLESCHSVATAIQAEGLGSHPFTAPDYATPPEGSAT